MPPGTYRVTVYAWAPDFAVTGYYITGVSIAGGALGYQLCGGSIYFPGDYLLGLTHGPDVVRLPAGGNIVFDASNWNLYGTVNGVQIEPGNTATTYCTAKVN